MKIFILFLIFSNYVFGQDVTAKKKIEVVIGQDEIVNLDFTPFKSEVGAPGVVDVKMIPSKRQLILKGMKKTGTATTVTIFNSAGDIKGLFEVDVKETNQGKVIQELKEFLGDIEGLEIKIKGGKIVLEGQLIVPSDIGRINVILDQYKDVLVLVEMAPQTQLMIAKRMQDEIQKAGNKNVTVRVVNGSYWLEGVTDSNEKKAKAELIAGAYVPDSIDNLAKRQNAVKSVQRELLQNFIQVNAESKPPPVPKLLKITAQFVELTKDYNKVFGFKWIPLMNDGAGQIQFGKTNSGGVTSKSSGTLSATISNLFPKLASAKGAGYARVVQSGVVITQENVAASISKSTSKPFAIGTGEFQRGGTATAGFTLDVTPKMLPEEKVDLDLTIVISANVGDPPETISNRIKTKIVVKSKESSAIGGVVISKNSTDYDRDPPFGRPEFDEGKGVVPLFSFLRSKGYVSNRNQFVIFVTPEIIESASEGSEETKRKFRLRRK
jgi:pilus assembly protein CpaC